VEGKLPNAEHPVTVRRLRAEDHDRWRALWSRYLSFYRAALPDAATELAFRRLVGGDEGMVGLVGADTNDVLVGLAHLIFHNTTWSSSPYCYLEDLYVDQDHRGGEVARTLFAAIYSLAEDRGAHRVYWHTQQFNAPARSLYDTVGQLTSFVVYEHHVGGPADRRRSAAVERRDYGLAPGGAGGVEKRAG
jgi:GNAT superfamily N-acetyltransferase